MKRLLFIFATFLITWLSASAYNFMVNGLAYNKNSDGTSLTVTYDRPDYTNYNGRKGSLIIPEKVTYSGKTYTVTGIGQDAFRYCDGITSLSIP
ncbi:MAG: hypothetical protein KBT09_06760, partial [Bacteroidales bacterium]|nr:hypothetical protein [Candidatus Sodaliphilus fimicaballi]